jgi:hypothetical protein
MDAELFRTSVSGSLTGEDILNSMCYNFHPSIPEEDRDAFKAIFVGAVDTLTAEDLAALVRFWTAARGLQKPILRTPYPLELVVNTHGSIAPFAASSSSRSPFPITWWRPRLAVGRRRA